MAGFSSRQHELIRFAGIRGVKWWASRATAAAPVAMLSRDNDEWRASQATKANLFRSLEIAVSSGGFLRQSLRRRW